MRRLIGGILIAWALAVFVESSHSAPQNLKVCVLKLPGSTLIVLAKELGEFDKVGLNVDLEVSALGRTCMKRLQHRDVDFGIAFTAPAVKAVLGSGDLRVISQLQSSVRTSRILYSTKAGIHRPKDLIGKKVALVRGTDSEFIFRLFALAHDLPTNGDIKIVNTEPDKLVESLVSGKADAAVLWSPLVEMALQKAPDRLLTFDSSFFTEFTLLVTSTSEISSGRAVAFVRALAKAQEFLRENPDRARSIMQRWFGWPPEIPFNAIWPKHKIELKLSSVFKTFYVQQARYQRLRPSAGQELERPGDDNLTGLDLRVLGTVLPDAVTFQ